MCGICVWIHRRGGADARRLAAAVQSMRHRGPDSRNLWLWSPDGRTRSVDLVREPDIDDGGYTVALGHDRLSIIDLSDAANQPMLSADGGAALVFNGEIYNYIEERAALQAAGERFATSSDTEVLLTALRREGPGCMRRMNGMWALGLFESGPGRLTLSRDRYGKKPLFYYHDADQFIAASEIKAIYAILGGSRAVDPDFVYAFLMGKRWPVFDDFRSMYRDIHQLPPGSSLTYRLETHAFEVRRDNPIDDFLDLPLDPHLAEDPAALRAELFSAVDLRLRSDVPVAVMVSGGVDSTAIAACAVQSSRAGNVSFYTIDTKDPDDLRYSRLLADALGIRLVEVPARLDEAGTWAAYRDILAHFEVPVYLGLVVLPGYLVCRKMAEDGVRVALDGTGGDEVLGGYPGYFRLALENSMRAGKVAQAFRLKRMVDRRASLRSHSFLAGWLRFFRRTAFPHRRPREAKITDSRAAFFARYARCADAAGLEGIIGECFWRDRLTEVEAMQEYDLKKGQMPTYLYINDQVSMIHSVETRSPLMDYRLYKYLRLPLDLKFRDGFNKHLLRRALPESVPDAVRWREAKAGFALNSPDIFAARRGEMEACVRECAALRDLFDLDALLAELPGLEGQSHFRELLEHLYSVALLDTLLPLRV